MKSTSKDECLLTMRGLLLLSIYMLKDEEDCNKDRIRSFLLKVFERCHRKGLKDSPQKFILKVLQKNADEIPKLVSMLFDRHISENEVADIWETHTNSKTMLYKPEQKY